MLATQLGFVQFCAVVSALALGLGRLLKAKLPQLPKRALPPIVILFAFGCVVADAMAGGAGLVQAAQLGAWGLVSGALAVGGHETAKAILEPLVGAALTEAILGKLADRVRP